MKAKLLYTQGTYLEAVLEVEERLYCVMDKLSLVRSDTPKTGEPFEYIFSAELDDDESWVSVFQSNPECRKCLEQITGWKYTAYGEIMSVNPVTVDCGVMIVADVVHSHDEKMIGEFIAFTISRLSGYRA